MDTNQFSKLSRCQLVLMAAPTMRGGSVTATLMPQNARMGLMHELFNKHFITVEILIYTNMVRVCPHYQRGEWAFYLLSNGGFYMAPLAAPSWFVVYAAKEYQGSLLSNPTGMLVTSMALNQLTCWRDGEYITEMAFRLRDFIRLQPEADRLCDLLD